ncbi:hypothetical protein OG558_15415 [Kribbella sp. NBC_01510]|uniref:trypco2 family protein n=1 Tax=Kribbella sp. NBC_01510 TaxID=2903581 RepID=UPI00386D7718
MDKAVVGPADAIEALRAELTSAVERSEQQRMRFSLEPIELSIQVAGGKDADGKIGWVVREELGRVSWIL